MSAAMMLCEDDLNWVLNSARMHYKSTGGRPTLKSGNKIYPRPQNAKQLLRNANAEKQNAARAANDALSPAHGLVGFVEGAFLTSGRVVPAPADLTAGNCDEMVSVTLDACLRVNDFIRKVNEIWVVQLKNPSVPHQFVMLSARGSHERVDRFVNIHTMSMQPLPPRALWVLDCWLNVACEATAYRGRAVAAIANWHTQGKAVWGDFFDTRTMMFNVRGYAGNFLYAPLAYNRVWPEE